MKDTNNINLITRRGFLDRGMKIGLGAVLASLMDIPPVLQRALADGFLGNPGPDGRVRKLLFVFLRGANDGLNTLIPIRDDAYNATNRPLIMIPKDPITATQPDFYAQTGPCDFFAAGSASTYGTYPYALRLGNGFAALHPSLKFLAPVYNAGHLALIHRVGYPRQSRSHFDSQAYWENGDPNNNLNKEGLLYRAILQSGQANTRALTGVSIQSSLPLLLRGSQAAMTNLSSIGRYDLLNIPQALNTNAVTKADLALLGANPHPFPDKQNREMIRLQYDNLMRTLPLFKDIAAQLSTNFVDHPDDTEVVTDGDFPYTLFPMDNDHNGGYLRSSSPRVTDANKYVVDTGAYGFFTNLKAAALVLKNTEAIIAGTEFGNFDTHQTQVQTNPINPTLGTHANLLRRIGWMMYALRKFFSSNQGGTQVDWDHLLVVTLSEFGRTTVQNSDAGTDHAEAGVMFVGGGGLQGYSAGIRSGVWGCSPDDPVPWATGQTGSMFSVSNRYLKRFVDYRSVLGECVRWLGATSTQLPDVIPGYLREPSLTATSPTAAIDGTQTVGELGFLPRTA